MLLFYRLGLGFYFALISFFSLFNSKAKLFIDGRKDWKNKLPDFSGEKVALFHCASLGEFEQARPVLEAFRATYPDWKIVLSFFSPSGYEVRKNYAMADYLCYLPLDSPSNAYYFAEKLKPTLAFFVKYEFWYFTLQALKASGCHIISFSAIFRPQQVYFKPWGSVNKKALSFVNQFFVQDSHSIELLKTIGITTVALAGDTRLDRVSAIASEGKVFPEIENFKGNQPLCLIGSAWPVDTDLLLPYLINQMPDWKAIIAPHELKEAYLAKIEADCQGKAIRYSQLKPDSTARYLIIDNIGMLSHLYRYADFAWIGGGFGSGIHNTMEAAAFGIPIGIGPNYARFKEAVDLISLETAFSASNEPKLDFWVNKLITNEPTRKAAGLKAKNYVEEHKGATLKILAYCQAITGK